MWFIYRKMELRYWLVPGNVKNSRINKGSRMVFASIYEHASSAFIFASTSSDQFSHASSEHLRNYKLRAASTS